MSSVTEFQSAVNDATVMAQAHCHFKVQHRLDPAIWRCFSGRIVPTGV